MESTRTWNNYSISKFLNANKNCIRNKVIYLISFLITWNETQMHDLIFMYQPKPISPLSLSLQRKRKEKRRNLLTTGYSATTFRCFCWAHVPQKKYGKETVIACYESKKMLKGKIRIKIRKIGTYMSIL